MSLNSFCQDRVLLLRPAPIGRSHDWRFRD
jgi:hypothetical protein